METFKQFYSIELDEALFERDYKAFLHYVNNGDILLKEFVMPSFLKKKVDFIKDLSSKTGMKFQEAIKVFKNKKIFKIMSHFGWGVKKLYSFVKTGGEKLHKVIGAFTQALHDSPAGQGWDWVVKNMDDIVKKHPILTKITGVGVASILMYIWFNMTFTGHAEYDFNMGDMLDALAGKFSLTELFSGAQGLKLLMFLVTGKAGLSFPWPGGATTQFTLAVIATLAMAGGIKLKQKLDLKKGKVNESLDNNTDITNH